jgi:26S proteasome regulatory subunit N10
MKKNNVAIDIVSFGADSDLSDNDGRLRAFVDSVNSADNSHFVSVPAGVGLLSDQIRASGMLADDGQGLGGSESMPGAAPGGGGDDGEFGVDPNLDPELAMVRL